MKKNLTLFSILLAMVSCCNQPVDTAVYHNVERTNDVVYEVNNIFNSDYTIKLCVIVIDSCEYIIGRNSTGYAGYGYLSHKGNCKYCAERRKRELQK